MIKLKLNILILVYALTGLSLSYAQSPQAKAKLDKESMLVGQQIYINLECAFPSNALIKWPVFTDTIINGVEIIDVSNLDTLAFDKKITALSQKIKITSFDSGNYIIPPFKFIYNFNNDTNNFELETFPLDLNVKFVEIDTTLAIKEIKAPLDSPYTFREILPWLLGLITLVLLSLLIIYIVNRIRKKKPLLSFSSAKEFLPHEQALKNLEILKNKKLWEKGSVKEYYSELTDIIKLYTSKRFEFQALEMTSDEILNALQNKNIDEICFSDLKYIFYYADMAKFAKALPLPDENDASIKKAFDFVNKTIPVIATDNNYNNKSKEISDVL